MKARVFVSPKASVLDRGPRYLRITDIQNDCVEWSSVPRVSMPAEEYGRYRLQPGDIVFARSGATVGKSFLIREDPGKAVFASYLIRVRCRASSLDPEYAALFFRSSDYWQQISDGATGTGQPNFNGTKLGALRIPIRPLEEQREITAKLETLLARSKNAREKLARIPRLVERYKQAILAKAFRGDLTRDWREKHPQTKSGEDLFAEIQSLYRAQLHKKRDDRLALELDPSLPDLPSTWTWCPVALLSSIVSDGVHKKPNYVENGIPFLTVRNLTAGEGISFDNCRFVTPADHKEFIKRTHPERGDLLISKDGTLGVVRAVRTDTVFSIFVSVALVKPTDREMTDYLELAFASPQVQQQMVGVGTGLQHIHLTDLRKDLIPIAPPKEREELVKRVRAAFCKIEGLVAEVNRAAKLCQRLDQANLTKAFNGELVI